MFKILQTGFQLYVNLEISDVQAGFRKGWGTRDQIANIHWIMEKAREFQKNITFCFIDYAKAFDSVDYNKLNIQKTKIMASSSMTSWQIDGEKVEAMTFFFLGPHCWQWLQPWN